MLSGHSLNIQLYEGPRKNPGRLSSIEFSRKLVVKFQGVSDNFPQDNPGNFRYDEVEDLGPHLSKMFKN